MAFLDGDNFSPLVIWQIHLCSCKSFAKIVPIQKNYNSAQRHLQTPLRLTDFCSITYKQNYQNGSYNFKVFWVQISTAFEQLKIFFWNAEHSIGIGWVVWFGEISGAIFGQFLTILNPFLTKFQDSNGSWKGWTGRYCGHSCPRRFSNVCGSVPRIWYNSCIRSSRCRQCRLRPRQLSRRRRRPRGRRHWSRRPQRQRHSLQSRVI